MGGLVCHNVRVAILQFNAVPTEPAKVSQFDKEMRTLYANPIIADSLESMDPSPLPAAIAVLSKPSWSLADRTTLLNIVESLYE